MDEAKTLKSIDARTPISSLSDTPVKPPRTFAHDHHKKKKDAKQERLERMENLLKQKKEDCEEVTEDPIYTELIVTENKPVPIRSAPKKPAKSAASVDFESKDQPGKTYSRPAPCQPLKQQNMASTISGTCLPLDAKECISIGEEHKKTHSYSCLRKPPNPPNLKNIVKESKEKNFKAAPARPSPPGQKINRGTDGVLTDKSKTMTIADNTKTISNTANATSSPKPIRKAPVHERYTKIPENNVLSSQCPVSTSTTMSQSQNFHSDSSSSLPKVETKRHNNSTSPCTPLNFKSNLFSTKLNIKPTGFKPINFQPIQKTDQGVTNLYSDAVILPFIDKDTSSAELKTNLGEVNSSKPNGESSIKNTVIYDDSVQMNKIASLSGTNCEEVTLPQVPHLFHHFGSQIPDLVSKEDSNTSFMRPLRPAVPPVRPSLQKLKEDEPDIELPVNLQAGSFLARKDISEIPGNCKSLEQSEYSHSVPTVPFKPSLTPRMTKTSSIGRQEIPSQQHNSEKMFDETILRKPATRNIKIKRPVPPPRPSPRPPSSVLEESRKNLERNVSVLSQSQTSDGSPNPFSCLRKVLSCDRLTYFLRSKKGVCPIRKSLSDTYLYSHISPSSNSNDIGKREGSEKNVSSFYEEVLNVDSIYHEPNDCLKMTTPAHEVAMDEDLYAIPHNVRHPAIRKKVKVSIPLFKYSSFRSPRDIKSFSDVSSLAKKKITSWKSVRVRERVSQAYSVIHVRDSQMKTKVDEQNFEDVSQLSSSLSSTATSAGDSDSDIDMEMHEQRLSLFEKRRLEDEKLPKDYGAEGDSINCTMFEFAVLVELESSSMKPRLVLQHPSQDSSLVSEVRDMCFPDAKLIKAVPFMRAEIYSFLLKNDGDRRLYAYCYRVLSPGAGPRYPEVFCVISQFEAHSYYEQLLSRAAQIRGDSLDLAMTFFQKAQKIPLPKPGQEAWIKVSCYLGSRNSNVVTILRSPDSRREVSFQNLFSNLSNHSIIAIFTAMLSERKIILVAEKFSVLIGCIHPLSALLYPFVWPHTFIPALPASKFKIIDEDQPYFVGILRSDYSSLQQSQIKEAFVVDLDADADMQSTGAEGFTLPKKLTKVLLRLLQEDSDSTSAQNEMIAETFLRFFVETISHFTEFLVTQQDGKKVFQQDLFCQAVCSNSIRLFLEWFSKTKIFLLFLHKRLISDTSTTVLFDRRVAEYRVEMEGLSKSFKTQIKFFKRRVFNIFADPGGKGKSSTLCNRNVYV